VASRRELVSAPRPSGSRGEVGTRAAADRGRGQRPKFLTAVATRRLTSSRPRKPIGLPRYAKQAVDQQFARWVMLHVQFNPLPICTRPRVLIKGKRT
jgi:hypothetical protein